MAVDTGVEFTLNTTVAQKYKIYNSQVAAQATMLSTNSEKKSYLGLIVSLSRRCLISSKTQVEG